ncbi:hypothetical protein L202_03407 [Cryptococcus amylolentus CBS 6039]|uniref:Derlin n=1 Tax=Cryptococcus amylolentus CBS 6039 TaxID=1295533 RepID=A0A1E3HUJ5_9TREE|nr:hypothetical protein L202_03407 [Cryptococcus amylolentus CBS 6039]ODN79416.1 hypothetical protein L202_03407 [Cryptococcus amylolentus CBS 6039]
METLTYRSDTAEYAWLHIMLSVFIILFNIPIGLPFLFRPLLLAQTYVWCRVNPTVRVSIFGLFTLPTSLYPPALILLDLLTGGPAKALGGIVGLLAGHLWWFLFTYLPSHAPSHLRRANPLATPLFFKRQFPASQPMPQTVTVQQGQRLHKLLGIGGVEDSDLEDLPSERYTRMNMLKLWAVWACQEGKYAAGFAKWSQLWMAKVLDQDWIHQAQRSVTMKCMKGTTPQHFETFAASILDHQNLLKGSYKLLTIMGPSVSCWLGCVLT